MATPSSPIRNTGSRPKSSWQRPTRAGCAPAAATGIPPADRPKYASWIGADRDRRRYPIEKENRRPHSASEDEGDVAAGARLFGSPADGVRLVPSLSVAG